MRRKQFLRSFISTPRGSDHVRLLLIAFVFVFLLSPWTAQAAKVRVVATVPDLAAIAQAVGGDHVEVRGLALPTQDAHFVDAKPNMALMVNRADLLILVGLDLEIGWLPTLLTGARNPRVQPGMPGYLDAGAYVNVKGIPTTPIDRSMGDIHPGGNPHYLHDPNQGLRVANAIAERLSRIDPKNAQHYQDRLSEFKDVASRRIQRWEAKIEPHSGARVVTYHASWIYLLDWLEMEEIDTIEPKPGIPPSPAHVARLLARMRAQPPALILQEAYYPTATARMLGERAGVPVLVLPGGTDFQGGEAYLDHIENNVRAIAEALEKSTREDRPND